MDSRSNYHILSTSRVAMCCVILLCIVSFGSAQVRRSSEYSTFFSSVPTHTTITNFKAGGLFAIAGGVVFQGSSNFYFEDLLGNHPVSSSNVSLTLDARKNVYLKLGSEGYRLEIHQGLACPLAKFTARDGEIAYTVPPGAFLSHGFTRQDAEQLREAGVVLVADSRTGDQRIMAREFAATPFENLVEAADFADDVPLPANLKQRMIANVNTRVNSGQSRAPGTYINSDSQTTYQVHLVSITGRVETEGVPLRFSWKYASGGAAHVYDVTAIAQNWQDGTALTDFHKADAESSQYDVVSLFQNAGIFRQLKRSNPDAFNAFVSAVCGK